MDDNQLDVGACLARVRGGDEDAARQLFVHLHPLVAKIVRAHLPRRTSEEDLVQIVFAKVFSRLDQYRGQVPLEHWVSRIAANSAYNELNRERVRPELRHADLSEEESQIIQNLAQDTGELPLAQALGAREIVDKLLSQLNPADRLVISLLHLEGRSIEEIHRKTGWSATLVKVRAFRARRKMKKHLQQLLREHKP
ncbi:MAG: sigma-70 family RNA polymerase sigma factor [Verrucomicrobia bacterium]|nr:MAG: sigma-70 family RNA polymerase sigma factor [Verrucomicrobiota bacterium]